MEATVLVESMRGTDGWLGGLLLLLLLLLLMAKASRVRCAGRSMDGRTASSCTSMQVHVM